MPFESDHPVTVPGLAGPVALGILLPRYLQDLLRHEPVTFLMDGTVSIHGGGYVSWPVDWTARFAAEAEQRRASLVAKKTPVVAALAKLGIATVTAVYDGEGDSGQIDSITAHGADGTERPLEGDILVGDQPPEAIHEALDAFFWDCLTAYHDGFENNDGGYGEITIDVATASVTIEHNQRFTDIDSSSQEI